MVQIEKRKKKGRPSKADLAARRAAEEAGVSPSSEAAEAEVRRSLRRRSFRYSIIDYDEDYLDDDVVSDVDNNINHLNHNNSRTNHNHNRNHNHQHHQNEVDDDDDEVEDSAHEDDEDEDEEEDDDDDVVLSNRRRRRRKRGKKVKLVVKLNNNSSSSSINRKKRRNDEDEEDEDDEEDEREVKKRRINGDVDDIVDDDDDDDIVEDNAENNEDDEGTGDGKEDTKGGDDYASDIPNGGDKSPCNEDGNTPLPDKKQLELILDKLQKKDTYGVYAEPVDPEELPDYHDVIDHPMDFSTVRKKLANGSYSTMEQFESDVFLISSNAMQYNAPETVYHKQARAIKELAEKKFQRIRMQIERLEKEPKSEPRCEPKVEPKSEQKERSYSVIKKQTKKLFHRGTQEQLGSDYSSGATLATMDAPNLCGTDHVIERPSNNDGPVEGILSLPDNNIEKAEDVQPGKGVLPKFGRRSFVVDENRRATYNISNQPEDRSESVFTTFEDDKKQLIPVGLSGEYPYARSLARFAANLGPRAWGVASKRIEQVLPPGLKHGRGWIGEYEPLPTAVLVVKHLKDPFASSLHNVDSKKDGTKDHNVSRSHDTNCSKDDKLLESQAQVNVHHQLNQCSSNGNLVTMFGSGGAKPLTPTTSIPQHQNPFSRSSERVMLKETESNCPSTDSRQSNPLFQQQSRFSRDSFFPENMGAKRVEPNSPSISDQKRDYISQKQLPHGMEIGKKKMETNSQSTFDQKTDNVPQKQPHCMQKPASMPSEPLPKGKNFLQSLPFKQPDANGGAPDGLSNGKVVNNFVSSTSNRIITSSPSLSSPQLPEAPVSFPQRQDQGLSSPQLPGAPVSFPQRQDQGLSSPQLPGAPVSFPQRQDQGLSSPQLPGAPVSFPQKQGQGLNSQQLPGALVSFPQRQDQGSPQLPGAPVPFPQKQGQRVNSPQLPGAPVSLPQRQDQGLSDPVLVMKMLTEKAQKQQNGSNHTHSSSQARPSVPSPRGDTGGNAAAAAASAWMSVGSAGFRPAAQNSATNRSQISADSLYNATRMFYPQAMQAHVEYPISAAMHFPPEKTGLPFQSFAPQPTKVGIEAQVPSRPMACPQMVTNDLSRFQVQAPWRGLSPHTQPKQKQDTLPPDLNVAFQSSVDSQQPDLALQL